MSILDTIARRTGPAVAIMEGDADLSARRAAEQTGGGTRFDNDLACRYGLEGAARRVQDLYLSGRRDEAARAIPAELVEGTTIVGPAGLVRERLAVYREAGVTVLNLRPAGPEPVRTIGRVRELLDSA